MHFQLFCDIYSRTFEKVVTLCSKSKLHHPSLLCTWITFLQAPLADMASGFRIQDPCWSDELNLWKLKPTMSVHKHLLAYVRIIARMVHRPNRTTLDSPSERRKLENQVFYHFKPHRNGWATNPGLYPLEKVQRWCHKKYI